MKISARNQISGRVSSINVAGVMAEVVVDIGNGNALVSVITRKSADAMGLRVGDDVTAVIKSTEIMIAK
jgi:molybdopterin-binding protein